MSRSALGSQGRVSPLKGTGRERDYGYADIVVWRCVLSAVCEKAGPVVRPFVFFPTASPTQLLPRVDPTGLIGQGRALARQVAQPRFLGAGAPVDGFQAYGANPNVRFAGRRESLPITGAFAAVELVTTKNACHARKFGGKTENVKSGESPAASRLNFLWNRWRGEPGLL